jgi:ElaB/YqjD/DUF883 family membrane-anchored ribosome-binding protein
MACFSADTYGNHIQPIVGKKAILMENSLTSSLAKSGRTLADKAADKVQSGVRIARETAKDAGDALSSNLEDVRSEAGAVVNTGLRRAQATGRQSLDAITDAVGQAYDAALNASDAIVSYTKKNPLKSLAIAAASGALLYTVIKASSPSRD